MKKLLIISIVIVAGVFTAPKIIDWGKAQLFKAVVPDLPELPELPEVPEIPSIDTALPTSKLPIKEIKLPSPTGGLPSF